ncbi:MAG: cytoplasmic protein [Deltaproteobacteria bacterium]|nr:cytoplasmic protein [Deltaproteobacteria bacterium]
MTRPKPSRTAGRKVTRRKLAAPEVEAAVRETFADIVKIIDDAKANGAFSGRRASRHAAKPSAARDPGAPFARIVADAKTEDQQLRALETAAQKEVTFPGDAFVIGEPVEVAAIHYSGHPRAGLTVHCRRGERLFDAALAHVEFLPGSDGARFVSLYRAWLGLGELPPEPRVHRAAPARRHKVTGDDIASGEPVELVVLACKSNALRCRLLGTASELTLRTAVRDEVPGEIVSVVPTKQWTHAGHTYVAAKVASSRNDVEALGLTPLVVKDEGEWDPEKAYWGEEGEPIDEWAKPIIAHGKRRLFEMEQVIPRADPEDWDFDPIIEASELNAAGDRRGAREMLMGMLALDLRCLDAHAHLGNFEFDHRPEQALRHYQVGVDIGVFSIGKKFNDVLAWDLIDNRPFLRCLHGLGLCWWRFGKMKEAAGVFRKMLWLNPSDNQGARFNLACVDAGREWKPEA